MAQEETAAAEAGLAAARKDIAAAENALRAAGGQDAEYGDDGTSSRWQRAAAAETVSQAQRTFAVLLETSTREAEAAKERLAAAGTASTQPPTRPGASAPTAIKAVPTGREPQFVYGSTEAASRAEALWRAWEHLRLDAATGMSVW